MTEGKDSRTASAQAGSRWKEAPGSDGTTFYAETDQTAVEVRYKITVQRTAPEGVTRVSNEGSSTTLETVTRDVYMQEVFDLDLPALVSVVNGLKGVE